MKPLHHSTSPPATTARRSRLYEIYLRRAGANFEALEATAIRTESLHFRELLAYAASGGHLSFAEVDEAVRGRRADALEPVPLATLARVCAFQNLRPHDRRFAIGALAAAVPRLSSSRISLGYRILEMQLLLEARQFDAVAQRLEDEPALRDQFPHVLADLTNPFTGSSYADDATWAAHFNHELVGRNYEPVSVARSASKPFDRLTAGAPRSDSHTLISVILTTYAPQREALMGSVMSILGQTWEDLELLVIDDASPPAYDSLFDEVASLDERIRLVRLPENRGTYAARNHGLELVRGTLITGQDDDWSHPRRLETQARVLDDLPATPAARVGSLIATESLLLSLPGYGHVGQNASSLMYRRRWHEAVGGYLPLRKAADNEFHHRLAAVSGERVAEISDPLTVIRLAEGSLSRGDYRPGWSHPARRAFRSAYLYWHRTAGRDALYCDPVAAPVLPVPGQLAISPPEPSELDVVIAADWRQVGPMGRAMLEELLALLRTGLRVGIVHIEAARHMSERTAPVNLHVQALINDGRISQILMEDDATVHLLVVRDASILQFPPAKPSTLRVGHLVLQADERASSEGEFLYEPEECHATAESLFGRPARWAPGGPLIRQSLAQVLGEGLLADTDVTPAIDLPSWRTTRRSFRGRVPVIGRFAGDNAADWPDDPTVLRGIYPTDGSMDVRLLGVSEVPRRILNMDEDPAPWLVFQEDQLPIRLFLSSIDFFVAYSRDEHEGALDRTVLEAMAAGCVVLLPPGQRDTYGEAAVYARAEDTLQRVHDLFVDRHAYENQQAKAWAVLGARFSYRSYTDRIGAFLGLPPKE